MTHSVGIDVSCDDLHVAVYAQQGVVGRKRFANSWDGVEALVAWCAEQDVSVQQAWFVVENTGVYSAVVCYGLHQRGLRMALVSPLQVREGFRARKTDEVDACRLAEYGYRFADRLQAWEPVREVVVQLEHLLQVREQYRDTYQRLSNLLQSIRRQPFHAESLVQELEERKAQCQQWLQRVEERIRQLISSDEELRLRQEQVCSVRRCGEAFFWQLAVVTEGFRRMVDGRALASWAGVCPHERRSGRRVYKGGSQSRLRE